MLDHEIDPLYLRLRRSLRVVDPTENLMSSITSSNARTTCVEIISEYPIAACFSRVNACANDSGAWQSCKRRKAPKYSPRRRAADVPVQDVGHAHYLAVL